MKHASKNTKTKEKELAKLQDENDNLTQSNETLKFEIKVLETEKNKALKEKTKLDKNDSNLQSLKPSRTKSNSTSSYSSLNRSTNTTSNML